MPLPPLTLSAAPAGWVMTAALTGESPADVPCVFCGIRSGPWQTSCDASADTPSSNNAACPLCALALHLERPRIDEEAGLLWLPEMSQQAINTTMREIHMQLRALGEGLHVEYRMRLDTPDRRALHHARATLADRTAMAAARLGTSAPRELGSALRRLSPGASSRRATLLGGLRLLPLGQFYEGGTDVYPEIVDTWLALAKPASQRSLPVAPNRLFRRR